MTVSGTVITFTPAANFNGPASITYTVTDDAGTPLSDTGTIAVTVNPVNDAPVAVDTTATTDEDTAVTVDVASLISDVDSTNLTVTASVDPLQGTVTVSGTVITFTPAANFNGPASITYTVTDDAGTPLSDTGTIAVTVNPVNDAPVAVDTTATTDEDTAVTVDVASLISDVDLDEPDGDGLGRSAPGHGDGVWHGDHLHAGGQLQRPGLDHLHGDGRCGNAAVGYRHHCGDGEPGERCAGCGG